MSRGFVAVLMVALLAAAPGPSTAQNASPQADQPAQDQPARNKARARAPQTDMDEDDQFSPRQLEQRATRPARKSEPRASEPATEPGQPATEPARSAPAAAARTARSRRTDASGHTIDCNGVFARDSSHMKLANRFEADNVVFTAVDGPEGEKLMASVVFPNDPKRRLEVLWQDESARSNTLLIAINGQSTWTGPRGLRLGMSLAALEKLNGKPFRIAGFDQPNGGSVADWEGGALDTLPGGCRAGIRLAPDAKATEAAVGQTEGKELMSNDARIRAARPIVAEILIGY